MLPQAEEGKRVKIRYTCRLEDGTIYDFTDRDTLEFIVGEGEVFAEFEKSVIGMSPGEIKEVRIPAAEAAEFAFQGEAAPGAEHLGAGTTGVRGQYNIAPGEEGDVLEEPFPTPMHVDRPKRRPEEAGQDLIFEIELLEVQEGDVVLHEPGEEREPQEKELPF